METKKKANENSNGATETGQALVAVEEVHAAEELRDFVPESVLTAEQEEEVRKEEIRIRFMQRSTGLYGKSGIPDLFYRHALVRAQRAVGDIDISDKEWQKTQVTFVERVYSSNETTVQS